jgi:hypothetical protein
MALYAYPENPGNWQTFVLRQDVKDLPVDQQRKKYLTEQLQYEDFISQQRYLQEMSRVQLNNQLHQGGNIAGNKVKEVSFASEFPVNINNTSQLRVVTISRT